MKKRFGDCTIKEVMAFCEGFTQSTCPTCSLHRYCPRLTRCDLYSVLLSMEDAEIEITDKEV